MQLLLNSIVKNLLDAVAVGTVTSDAFAMPARSSYVTWQTSFGSAPSAINITIEGSLDNSHWSVIDTTTVTTGAVRSFATAVIFVRAKINSVTGGTTATVSLIAKPYTINSLVNSSGGTPGGSNTQIQFNNSGAFGANAGLTYSGASHNFTLTPVSDVEPIGVATPAGGATFAEYWVVAVFADGSTTGGGNFYAEIEDGPAILDSTHYNTITWAAVPGASSYEVWTDERDGSPGSIGKLGTVPGGTLTFRDDGVAGDDVVTYAINSTGMLSAPMVTGSVQFRDPVTFLQAVTINTTSSDVLGAVRAAEIQLAYQPLSDPGSNGNNIYLVDFVLQVPDPGFVLHLNNQYGFRSSIGYFQAGTVENSYAATANISNRGTAAIATAYGGIYNVSNVGAGSIAKGYGVSAAFSGVITGYAFYAPDLASAATNAYYSWFDSRGVRRVKEDATFDSVGQAIEALYNPQFTKYTPGAVNFERIILGRWNGNIGEIGTEAGGTGTLRALNLIGSKIQHNGHEGISTTITTSSLVGKTITVQDGLITGFA